MYHVDSREREHVEQQIVVDDFLVGGGELADDSGGERKVHAGHLMLGLGEESLRAQHDALDVLALAILGVHRHLGRVAPRRDDVGGRQRRRARQQSAEQLSGAARGGRQHVPLGLELAQRGAAVGEQIGDREGAPDRRIALHVALVLVHHVVELGIVERVALGQLRDDDELLDRAELAPGSRPSSGCTASWATGSAIQTTGRRPSGRSRKTRTARSPRPSPTKVTMRPGRSSIGLAIDCSIRLKKPCSRRSITSMRGGSR